MGYLTRARQTCAGPVLSLSTCRQRVYLLAVARKLGIYMTMGKVEKEDTIGLSLSCTLFQRLSLQPVRRV